MNGKRRRESGPTSEDDTLGHLEPGSPKRLRATGQVTNEEEFTYQEEHINGIKILTVHEVRCQGGDGRHAGHQESRYFYDLPRLFANDHGCRALRGRHPVRFDEGDGDLDEDDDDLFSKNHPDVSFVLILSYSCMVYHERMSGRWHQLEMPALGREKRKLAPMFTMLREIGPPAESNAEGISIPSASLRSAMHKLKNIFPAYLRDFQPIYEGFPSLQIRSFDQFFHLGKIFDAVRSEIDANFDAHESALVLALCSFVQTRKSGDFAAADALFSTGHVSRRHLRKLFRPGDVVVSNSHGRVLAFEIRLVISKEVDALICSVDCTSWDYDGLFHQRLHTFNVSLAYAGIDDKISMVDLSIYPLRYDQGKAEDFLNSRGTLFWECRNQKFVSCASNDPILPATPRYMIDIAMYKRMHPPSETPASNPTLQSRLDYSNHSAPPTDTFVLMLPDTIPGYGFHDKKWVSLQVSQLREIEWNESAFKHHLVLEDYKKELIEALVTVHMTGMDSYQSDIIEGKGKGLMILLHGGPGTGKTLTAESIAELTRRPLYRVTCNDIGTRPEEVEKYLETVLSIGTHWNCVVLLDEADVFLEERTPSDLHRNALVSAFLRVLEYFEGVLILTSNRIGAFDEAFKSRVHLTLYYPPLDRPGREEIWNTFIQSMKKQGESIDYQDLMDKLELLAKPELNGRQIRNVVNTGRQLACAKKQPLACKHFQQVIKGLEEFERYITRTRGHTDDEYAATVRLRAEAL